METARIEALLERIASALEELVRKTSSSNAVASPCDNGPQAACGVNPGSGPQQQEAASQSGSRLEKFLAARSIRIKTVPAPDPADPVIDRLSLFLGERYEALASLLAKIKGAMQAGLPVTESLKGRSQTEISSACQFCTLLHEVAFLQEYQYLRSPQYLIRATTTTLPKAQRFFSGQWLERFVLQKIRAIQGRITHELAAPVEFEFLLNPQIVLPNGDDAELDILVAFGSVVYWIEAKSGAYQQHVAKYSKLVRVLGLDSEHSLMVLADAPRERCEALSSLFSMNVCNLRTFEDRLLAVVRSDLERCSTAFKPSEP